MNISFNSLKAELLMNSSWIIPSLFMMALCFVSPSHASSYDNGEELQIRQTYPGTPHRINEDLVDTILSIESPRLVLGGGCMWRSAGVWKRVATPELPFQDGNHVILDNYRGAGSAPWLKLDFNELGDLRILAATFPGHFQTIFFDTAVTKYAQKWTEEHLHCLATILAPEGQLFFPLMPFMPSALADITTMSAYTLHHDLFYYTPEETESFLVSNKENIPSFSEPKATRFLKGIFENIYLEDPRAPTMVYPSLGDDSKDAIIRSHPYWVFER